MSLGADEFCEDVVHQYVDLLQECNGDGNPAHQPSAFSTRFFPRGAPFTPLVVPFGASQTAVEMRALIPRASQAQDTQRSNLDL